jgi:large subunit ribosomal protein L22
MPAKSGREGADVPGVKTNEREGTRAVLRHSRMSAYKARQVLDQIRGMDADRAMETLDLGDREAAGVIAKVLASAVANAVHNDGLDAEELFVSSCYADEGSTLKRWRPRARGRATRIRKRTCHITIIVSRLPDDRIARRRAKQNAAGAQRSRRVAGSRRNRRAETTSDETTAPITDNDTGAEAWPEDAVEADDVITETEAGPLEESDFETDADFEDADEVDEDIDTVEADETDDATDADGTVDSIEDDTDQTNGDSAEEKGK